MIFKTANSTYLVDRKGKRICRLTGNQQIPTCRIGVDWISYSSIYVSPGMPALISMDERGRQVIQTSVVESLITLED